MEYLLVDGYNVINAWKDIFDLENESLEECREKLLTMLSNYEGYKKIKIIAVFDAHMVKEAHEKEEEFDNIIVVYTGKNETADNYIERFVYKMGNEHTVRVATSDYLEQRLVLKYGGIRVTPRELREEIESVHKKMTKTYSQSQKVEKNTIMSNIKPEIADILEGIRRNNK